MPAIHAARREDLPAIGRTLARAFADDPVWTYLVPRRAGWEQRAAAYFTRDAGNRLRHGTVYVDEQCTGAALWAPPDEWKTSLADIAREAPAGLRLFGLQIARGLRTLARVEKVHPRAPHHYLAVLGTDPDHQGKGIGSALITHVTDQADAEGLPAYLESSKESNVPFYARRGFEVTDRMELPGGPSIWTMWREPRS